MRCIFRCIICLICWQICLVDAQDLGLELEKRNITKKAEVTEIVENELEALPGVTSSNTFMPSSDLTPREASATTVLTDVQMTTVLTV